MRKPVYVTCKLQRRRSPAHLRSLISAFVVRCLDSITPLLAIAEISRLARLCSWAGRFESFLVGNPQRQVCSWHGSYVAFNNLSVITHHLAGSSVLTLISLPLKYTQHDTALATQSHYPYIWSASPNAASKIWVRCQSNYMLYHFK